MAGPTVAAEPGTTPSWLPVYDHIVIVVEENKDFDQILGDPSAVPYLRQLASEGAVFNQMFAEEHSVRATIFGCSPVATTTLVSSMRCRAKQTTPTTLSRRVISVSS
jgi:hypothetical protein